MLDPNRFQRLFAALPPEDTGALLATFSNGGDGRVEAVSQVLRTAGQKWRNEIGEWIATLLSVESLVPEAYVEWRPLVHDSMAFVASHISDGRLAPKVVEQIELPPDTSPETRLGLVIARTPGLQKLGQVLARTRRLSPSLRRELQKLENGISDVDPTAVREIVRRELASCIDAYKVRLASKLLSEASVSAILGFTWENPSTGRREEGVFKVMKPHIPICYPEDLRLLQELAEYLANKGREYGISLREVVDTLDEVRMLLEREVDFRREQATLAEVNRLHVRRGTHAPRPIPELCTDTITAMSVERGVKVTDAFRDDPPARRRLATQIIKSLIADPIFSEEQNAMFHADPHAGNLLVDERTGELIVLDWALTGRLTLEQRRQVARLMMAVTFRDTARVAQAVRALSLGAGSDRGRNSAAIIDESVQEYLAGLPLVCSPGPIDAMRLLDQIGLKGVRFPGCLVLIRKVLFTLDGVLHDVAGEHVRMENVISSEFVSRLLTGKGKLPPPFRCTDFLSAQRSAVLYATGLWSWPSGRSA
jgi:predicted unusual protein kinase regulating ubiquinone biosynthesis (AarF/ABC1/UbiB family)